MFQQLKKINERITNTEVKMALVGQPGAGKSRAANQILFSQLYMRQVSMLENWGKVPLISGAGDHITRKVSQFFRTCFNKLDLMS
jgi:GTPase SAR1 family protein